MLIYAVRHHKNNIQLIFNITIFCCLLVDALPLELSTNQQSLKWIIELWMPWLFLWCGFGLNGYWDIIELFRDKEATHSCSDDQRMWWPDNCIDIRQRVFGLWWTSWNEEIVMCFDLNQSASNVVNLFSVIYYQKNRSITKKNGSIHPNIHPRW